MPEQSPAESLFFAALERSPGDRSTFLEEACRGDTALRARVEKMLAAQPDLGDFLGRPVATPAWRSPPAGGESPPVELAGAVVAGRYKLLEQIGEGGMGSVWLAEQLHPISRQVAVKLVRGEYAGSRGILARFEAERQAIARMDHPHIAKLLDAGAAESGRPYFVMELVGGVPLNDYCDSHKLTVPDRLRLFVQICRAVQHAHQKGIIHRDLKPSNVLVEHHDGRPVPRVIDFGLAKAVGGARLPDETLFTRPGNVTGTPLYMAPEQAGIDSADIDTRADVYALGVNLYELLTGTTPIERERLKKVPLFEILHVIRDSDPPTPSKRLSSTDLPLAVAADRRTEPAKLGRLVRGDLDWIVMKALAKERDRRYESAAAFAADVERFLSHEPVLAGPPGAAYRLKKFVRRNRVQVVAAALVFLALLGGTVGATVGLVRAERARGHEAEQRARAEKGADRNRSALDALTLVATGSTLDEDMYNVRNESFLAVVLPYYQELAAERADDEASRARVAGAVLRVGTIQYRLGRRQEAEAAFHQAVGAYAGLAADFSGVPEYRRHLVTSHENLASTLSALGKPGVQDHCLQAFAVREKLAVDFPDLPWCRQSLATGHHRMGKRIDFPSPLGRDEHFRQAIAIQEQLAADFRDVPEYRRDLAGTHHDVGLALAREKPGEAEHHQRRAVEVQEKLAADSPKVAEYRDALAIYHSDLAGLLAGRGRKGESEEQFRAGLTVREKLVDDFPARPEYRDRLGTGRAQFGEYLVGWGKRPEAEREYRRAAAVRKQLCALFPGNDDYRFRLAETHDHLGVFALGRGDAAEAELHFREVVAFREQLVAQFPNAAAYELQLADSSCNLGVLVRDNGRPGESLVWFDNAERLLVAVRGRDPGVTAAAESLGTTLRCRAVAYHRVRKFAEAAKDWDRAFELLRKAGQGMPAPEVSSLPQTNSVPGAEADVAVLSAAGEWNAAQLYGFACVSARANVGTAEQRKEYADRAVELLRRAAKAGFADADRAAADADLAPLRDRDDFKKLLAELQKK